MLLLKITTITFFQAGMVTNPAIWLVLSAVRSFLSLTTVTVTLAWGFFCEFFFPFESLEKINKLFTGLRSVRIVKNCDLGHENAASVTVFHYTDLPAGK